MEAYKQQSITMAAIGGGIMWYWVGGSPFQGQDTMLLLQGYLAGGAGVYAYEYAMAQSDKGGSGGKKSAY